MTFNSPAMPSGIDHLLKAAKEIEAREERERLQRQQEHQLILEAVKISQSIIPKNNVFTSPPSSPASTSLLSPPRTCTTLSPVMETTTISLEPPSSSKDTPISSPLTITLESDVSSSVLVKPLTLKADQQPQVSSTVNVSHGRVIHNSFDMMNPLVIDDPDARRRQPPLVFRAGTREVHNKLEKHRRAHLKECFDMLKKQLPDNKDEKKTSNLSILHAALRTINYLKRQDRELDHELERLARNKITLQSHMAKLKKDYNITCTCDFTRLLKEHDSSASIDHDAETIILNEPAVKDEIDIKPEPMEEEEILIPQQEVPAVQTVQNITDNRLFTIPLLTTKGQYITTGQPLTALKDINPPVTIQIVPTYGLKIAGNPVKGLSEICTSVPINGKVITPIQILPSSVKQCVVVSRSS